MTYKLFIDDERFPASDGPEWVIARNKVEVLAAIELWGMPYFVSFDHDLGEMEPTGHAIAVELVSMAMDGEITFSDEFKFYVHSQNPVGKANIEGYLNGYLKVVRGE